MRSTISPDLPTTNMTHSAKIYGKVWAHIKSLDEGVATTQPVYAINWFDTKRMWLYNLYNVLASRSLKASSATPFFKGRLTTSLHGVEEDRRHVLLVVRYPSLLSFTKMLESGYFKFVSMLRVAAVENFTFGFSKRTDIQAISADDDRDQVYAVHHYRSTRDIKGPVTNLAQENNIEVFYSGSIFALLYTGDHSTVHTQIPCLMDGLIILRADTKERVKKFLRSEKYSSIVTKTDSSFIGLFERIL